jgi:hypothetical protein
MTAPLIVRHLIQSIDPTLSFAEIEAAYTRAREIVADSEPSNRHHEFCHWVRTRAEAMLADDDPSLVADGSDYARYGGSLQTAFMEPAFLLGFCLAYVFAAEQQGGPR